MILVPTGLSETLIAVLALINIHDAQTWIALGTWATCIVLLVTLIYVARQVKEQFRPWVTVSFHFRSIIAFVAVRNLGSTPARDLRIRFEPELVSTLSDNVGEVAMLNEKTPVLAPGEERLILLDRVPDRLDSELPKQHTAYLEYSDHRGRRLATERFVLDFGLLDGARLPDKGLHDLVESLDRIGEQLK